MEPAGDRDTVICPGVEGENLALRPSRDFRAATGWDAPPQTVTIAKRIPIAAGMAGGSGNAAAALRLASTASGAGSRTGSRCASAPTSRYAGGRGRALMTGAGEHVEPLPARAAA